MLEDTWKDRAARKLRLDHAIAIDLAHLPLSRLLTLADYILREKVYGLQEGAEGAKRTTSSRKKIVQASRAVLDKSSCLFLIIVSLYVCFNNFLSLRDIG